MHQTVPSSTHRARSGRGRRVGDRHCLSLTLDTFDLSATCLSKKSSNQQPGNLCWWLSDRLAFATISMHWDTPDLELAWQASDCWTGEGKHSRCCIGDKNRACNRICLRDKISSLDGRLKSRNYNARDCTGRYRRIRCLDDGRSRLSRYRCCNKCTRWLDRCLCNCLSGQSLSGGDERGRSSLDGGVAVK